jgi:hypothetical protein
MPPGIAPASSPGNSGMRLAARPGFYGVCKRGAAAKRAGAYGRLQRLINRIPLFRVWSEHRNTPWAELLGFWGLPNLQAINRDAMPQSARQRRAIGGPGAAILPDTWVLHLSDAIFSSSFLELRRRCQFTSNAVRPTWSLYDRE